MKEIPLTQGKVALVDDDDFLWLMRWKWRAKKNGRTFYAARTINLGPSNTVTVAMHRQIMKAPYGKMIDHANRNGLDNQRHNLRFANSSQNQMNKGYASGRSQYKGVAWRRASDEREKDRWEVMIMKEGVNYYLGTFPLEQEVEAAKAYDSKAIELFGEFACLNFPLGKE